MRGNPTSRENQAREGNPGRECVAVMVSLPLQAVATRQVVPDLFPLFTFSEGSGLSHLLSVLRELFSGIRRACECSVAPTRPCKLALASCGSLTYLNPSHTSQRSQDCLLSHLRPTDTRAQVQSHAGHLIWPVWAGSLVENNAGAGFSCLGS